MTSNEHNDNRPQDGQDQQEQRRAVQEAYDLETLARFQDLFDRHVLWEYFDEEFQRIVHSTCESIAGTLGELLDKEGF